MALLDPQKQKAAGDTLTGYSMDFSRFTEQCKHMVEARRARSPVQVEYTAELLQRIEAYERETMQEDKPLTMAGYILASGLKKDVFYRVLNGDYDYVVEEYRALHNIPADVTAVESEGVVLPLIPWSDILQNCRLRIQQQLEENCYTVQRGVNPAGSIFGLKAQHGWREEDSAPHTVSNTLVIADAEQALKALKALE